MLQEVLDIDKNAVGIYKEDRLVRPVPIHLSRTNPVKVALNGKKETRT